LPRSVPRTRDDRRLRREPREIFADDRDLRFGLDVGTDVEQITREHDEVVVARGTDDPVELLQ